MYQTTPSAHPESFLAGGAEHEALNNKTGVDFSVNHSQFSTSVLSSTDVMVCMNCYELANQLQEISSELNSAKFIIKLPQEELQKIMKESHRDIEDGDTTDGSNDESNGVCTETLSNLSIS
jgi:hypothetical protein